MAEMSNAVITSDGRRWQRFSDQHPPEGSIIWRWAFDTQNTAFKWRAGECKPLGFWSEATPQAPAPSVNPHLAAQKASESHGG